MATRDQLATVKCSSTVLAKLQQPSGTIGRWECFNELQPTLPDIRTSRKETRSHRHCCQMSIVCNASSALSRVWCGDLLCYFVRMVWFALWG